MVTTAFVRGDGQGMIGDSEFLASSPSRGEEDEKVQPKYTPSGVSHKEST